MNTPMLHHYTTVNTLALILRHQTLRFTRLDQFDDVTEGRFIGAYPFGARVYASCWSAADEESIPQWAMYGDAMRGVRLSLRPDPFNWRPIDIRWHEKFQFIDLEAPFTMEEMLGVGITLIPSVEMKKTFGQPVRYVPDVPTAIERFTAISDDGGVTFYGEGNEIAFLKSDAWAFQKEHRFVLVASPGPMEPFTGDSSRYLESRKNWHRSGVDFMRGIPSPLHVDLGLDHTALIGAEILVGPLAPAGTMEIVESLVARFAEGASVRESSLRGSIRSK